MAAHLDGRDTFSRGRILPARHLAFYPLARQIPAARAGFPSPAMAAGRVKPCSLHRGVRMGAAFDGGLARRLVSRRVAHLGVAMGGTPEMELVQRAALRRGPAGGGGRVGFVLAGIENGKTYQPVR